MRDIQSAFRRDENSYQVKNYTTCVCGRLHTCTISCNGYGYWFCLISTFPISDAISCEERGETDADLVVALYTMGKTELLKAVASAHHVIDLNRRREIANTVKMANERITSILNR